jgi:metal-sulfur cluster biosynthetic enzyme
MIHSMDDVAPRERALRTALTTVIDPKMGLDVVTLGLVYAAEVHGSTASVTYTLTTRGCPQERAITEGVRSAAAAVEGIARVETRIVWDPAWNTAMIAPSALDQA